MSEMTKAISMQMISHSGYGDVICGRRGKYSIDLGQARHAPGLSPKSVPDA